MSRADRPRRQTSGRSDHARPRVGEELASDHSSVQPAGLLNGITGSTAITGGGHNAALGDLRTLTDAIATAGGSGTSVMLFASPGRAVALKSYCPALASQVFGSAFIPSGTLIVTDPGSFASGFGADPEIGASLEGIVHMEDTSPQPIGTPGTPNVVAAPTRSAWQTDVVLLKCILRAAWFLRVPGAAAFISTGLSW